MYGASVIVMAFDENGTGRYKRKKKFKYLIVPIKYLQKK
jgi:Methionine synthase I, cobalamin-binding domain